MIDTLDTCPECNKPWERCSCDWCGCCGRLATAGEWCRECLEHIRSDNHPSWDRTWYARYGGECPFAVGP